MSDTKTIALTQEQLNALVAQAVATALAAQPVKAASSPSDKTEQWAKTDVAIVKAFKKAGYKDSQIKLVDRTDPKSEGSATILTYNRWLAQGRRVRKGESMIKVKTGRGALRLFHRDQTDVMTSEEKATALAEMQEAIAAYQAKKGKSQQATA